MVSYVMVNTSHTQQLYFHFYVIGEEEMERKIEYLEWILSETATIYKIGLAFLTIVQVSIK